jgi:nucleoside-triphosphatase
MRTGSGIPWFDPMNIVLTGVPGVGKTTLIGNIIESLGDRCGGIITRETRQNGVRTGFTIESLKGACAVLASRGGGEGPKVGPYVVNIANLETVGIDAVRRALEHKAVVIIDEIGKMELISSRFRTIIIEALDSETPVVATMGISGNTFMDAIRMRTDVNLITITTGNRNALKKRVLDLLERASAGAGSERENETD